MPFDAELAFGDVVLVPFPFTDQAGSKQRPAVVVSSAAYNRVKPDIIMMAVTSQLKPHAAFGEVWVSAWEAAGLLKPSAIKPVFETFEKRLIIRTLGIIGESDQGSLRTALTDILG